MRVIALFRVSTEAQANEGASLDAQERRYRELADRNNWETIDIFRGCESATQASKERAVLQQLLQCLKITDADAVYVHEQSRLTRGDELEVALLLRELRERRMNVIINGVVRDLDSLDDRFMIGIQGVVDRAEAERTRERMDRGKREKAKQGKKNSGKAPFGYRNPAPGDPNRGTLQMIDDEAAIVRRIFNLAAGGMSLRAICHRLNEEAVPAPRKGTWGKTTITRILHNPAYIGVHASNVWQRPAGKRGFTLDLERTGAIVVENAHQPIVDRDVWTTVHSRARVTSAREPRLLTGLIWVNGLRYSGDSTNGTSFYCHRRGGGPWLEVNYVDRLVWQTFTSVVRSPKVLKGLIHRMQTKAAEDDLRKRIKASHGELARLTRRIDRLTDMRADGEISRDVFLKKQSMWQEQIARVEDRIRQFDRQVALRDGRQADRIVQAVRTVARENSRVSKSSQSRILRSVVRKVSVTTDPRPIAQDREAGGRLGPRSAPKWRIQDVTFDLITPGGRAGRLDTPLEHCARRQLR